MVVNVGGASPPGYGLAYQALLGEPLLSAPDGSSFVTHWMVHAIIIAPTSCMSCSFSAGNHTDDDIQIMLAAIDKHAYHCHGMVEMHSNINMWMWLHRNTLSCMHESSFTMYAKELDTLVDHVPVRLLGDEPIISLEPVFQYIDILVLEIGMSLPVSVLLMCGSTAVLYKSTITTV